jgi:peptidoglycan/LPS O-acetylase OafA/YrhL
MMRKDDAQVRSLALLHALYFLIGGAWAVMGKRTFEAVTGPKVDYWLVRTVGGLLSVTGSVLALASIRNRLTPEIRYLAIGMSGVLASVSLVYSIKGRIRPVYLLDAVANVVLISVWIGRERRSADDRWQLTD